MSNAHLFLAPLCLFLGACLWIVWTSLAPLRKRASGADKGQSLAGFSVEVDCRACGKFNRVPQERLRDRPKCGQCKTRLMPKKTVTICRVSSMADAMRADINRVWDNEDKLWSTLADHVALQNKAENEKKNPNLRVMN